MSFFFKKEIKQKQRSNLLYCNTCIIIAIASDKWKRHLCACAVRVSKYPWNANYFVAVSPGQQQKVLFFITRTFRSCEKSSSSYFQNPKYAILLTYDAPTPTPTPTVLKAFFKKLNYRQEELTNLHFCHDFQSWLFCHHTQTHWSFRLS